MEIAPHKFEGLIWDERGFYQLQNADTGRVPVRLFLTEALLADVDDQVYKQIINATKFPGTKLVVITPDVHLGYGVPVGSVILTDAQNGAVAMGPVGYDIGCGDDLRALVGSRSGCDAGAAPRFQPGRDASR